MGNCVMYDHWLYHIDTIELYWKIHHPLKDLLPPLKNRALRGRSHPYQIPRVNTERFKKCFVNRCLFDSK